MNDLLLDELNPQQREAAAHINGPLLIVAGAGAGKTKTLTHRIANLIRNGVDAEAILAITFTNKAAAELRDRLQQLLQKSGLGGGRLPVAQTFHALGVRILREFGSVHNISRDFSILDRDDQTKIVKGILQNLGLEGEQWKPSTVISIISKIKAEGGKHEIKNPYIGIIFEQYCSTCKSKMMLDFDDLIVETVELLKNSKEVRDALLNKWKYIHVDEYQDTNHGQYEMVSLLTGPEQNICVVGDADQTIYTWRGATIRNILDFERDFKGAHTVLLEQNYRSTQTILSVANAAISKNTFRKEKRLYTHNEEGEPLELVMGADESDEARQVASLIQNHINDGVDPSDIAVLYRANFQSRALEEALIRLGIPYQLLGTKFFSRREVKDMLSYLRYALNPDSYIDLERAAGTPKRGIGAKTIQAIATNSLESLGAAAKSKAEQFLLFMDEIREMLKTTPPGAVMQHILEKSGLQEELLKDKIQGEDRLLNIRELINVAADYDSLEPPLGTHKLLEEAVLLGEQDSLKSGSGVKLMTVHASKGLEFDYVFIVGLEQGLFPSERDMSDKQGQEEERRLFYVALTRARKKAFLGYAAMRRRFGTYVFNSPSEFITEIDSDFLRDGLVADQTVGTGLLDDIEF